MSAGGLTVVSGGASITGSTVVNTLTINTSGLSITGGNCVCVGYVECQGVMYPGRVDTTGYQTSWYLASHGSFGLYTNTGFYMGANTLWCGPINCNTISCATINTQGYAIASGPINATGTINTSQGYLCRAGLHGGTSNQFNLFYNGAGGMQVWVDTTNLGFIAFQSDARIKRDFTPLTDSLGKVLQLRPGTFRFMDEILDSGPHLGLCAQDVALVAPELARNTGLVTDRTPDGMWQVNYTEMIPLLVAAIQELEEQVAVLRNGSEAPKPKQRRH